MSKQHKVKGLANNGDITKNSLTLDKTEVSLENQQLCSALGISEEDMPKSVSQPKMSEVVTPHSFTPEKMQLFLDELAEHSVIKYACKAAGISRTTFHFHYKHNPEFKELADTAMRIGATNIEDEAKIRAVEGVEEDVYFKGEHCGKVRKFSDHLLVFLLKAKFRHTYGDVREENVDTDVFGDSKVCMNRSVKTTDIDIRGLSDEQLKGLISSVN